MKKVLGIILGVLMIVGGIYCIANPAATFASLTIVMGITLIESAIANFIIWLRVKKLGGKNFLLFINSILSLIGGIFLLTNFFAQLIMQETMIIFIALYMVITGAVTIVNAFDIKKLIQGGTWIAVLIIGILMVIAGFLSIKNPLALVITIGVNMGINIIVVGASLIALSLAYKEGSIKNN